VGANPCGDPLVTIAIHWQIKEVGCRWWLTFGVNYKKLQEAESRTKNINNTDDSYTTKY
jgi:hypothetical protein